MVTYVFLLLLSFGLVGCTDNSGVEQRVTGPESVVAGELPKAGQKVTFVELGSVNCIPCRQMQPVMHAVEQKYRTQLKVVFYDIWKPDQRHYADTYGIRIIPTQVFLDSLGKEFYRHEGFLSEELIDMLLKKQGLVPVAGKN
ncbi:MAG: thioredoxin family protein [Chlorobiaceae bacterium]|nr:thioredoxin family protein [Chlorobiaceae bacterium]